MTIEPRVDPDTSRVEQVLGGAHRAPNDPDVELAMLLADLSGTSREDEAVILALRRLAQDARSG